MIRSQVNEDGVVFVIGKPNRYLVTYEIEGKLCEPKIETATEIFNRMAFSDNYSIRIRCLNWLREYSSYDELRREIDTFPACVFHEKYHDLNEPLKMKISKMFGDQTILDIGYAEEH